MKIMFTNNVMDRLGILSRKQGISIASLVSDIITTYVQEEGSFNERAEGTDKGKEEYNTIKL